jgi:hypothetical protein
MGPALLGSQDKFSQLDDNACAAWSLRHKLCPVQNGWVGVGYGRGEGYPAMVEQLQVLQVIADRA